MLKWKALKKGYTNKRFPLTSLNGTPLKQNTNAQQSTCRLSSKHHVNLFHCIMPNICFLVVYINLNCFNSQDSIYSWTSHFGSPSLTFSYLLQLQLLMAVSVTILTVTSHNALFNGIMWPNLIPWFYTTDLRPPGCRWAHPQCCSPPPLLLCPPASSSYGSCGHGSQPGSWQQPCWPQDHPGGCPWYPPPPGAGCSPPAEKTKK